ncbi:MAG: hypothetical protein SGCHY_004995 [Lobulomycetales sp.]
MKEYIAFIQAPDSPLHDRIVAFDALEMLVESLDNANDLAPLGLWSPLLLLLRDDADEIRKHAAWTIGTALRNNEKSQEHFLAKDGLTAVLARLSGPDAEPCPPVLLKLIRIVSALLPYPKPFQSFYKAGGFPALAALLRTAPPDADGTSLVQRILFSLTFCLEMRADDGVGVHQIAISTALACAKSGAIDAIVWVVEGRGSHAVLVDACLRLLCAVQRVHPPALDDRVRAAVKAAVPDDLVMAFDEEQRTSITEKLWELVPL